MEEKVCQAYFKEYVTKIILENSELLIDQISDKVSKITLEKITPDLLSPGETCKMFDPPISRTTLWNWSKPNKTGIRLRPYRIGRLVFYSRQEVLEAIKSIKSYRKVN